MNARALIDLLQTEAAHNGCALTDPRPMARETEAILFYAGWALPLLVIGLPVLIAILMLCGLF